MINKEIAQIGDIVSENDVVRIDGERIKMQLNLNTIY